MSTRKGAGRSVEEIMKMVTKKTMDVESSMTHSGSRTAEATRRKTQAMERADVRRRRE